MALTPKEKYMLVALAVKQAKADKNSTNSGKAADPKLYFSQDQSEQEEAKVAVQIKNNALAAMTKFGVPEPLLEWFSTSGFEVKLMASGFQCINPDKGGAVVKQVPVTVEQLLKLQQGKLSVEEQTQIQMSLVEALQICKGSASQPKPKTSALGLLPEQSGQKKPVSVATKWPEFDLTELTTAPLSKLRDASKMYQPVSGTSEGSRYYMIAANDDLRVAVRWNGTQLSIRIEGPGFSKHTSAIKAAGFDKKSSSGESEYTSLHLACPNDVIARKALGAVLMGIGVPMQTPMPDLNLIKGK